MGSLKLPSIRWTSGVDAESVRMNDDVVVVPAQQCEVVRTGGAAPMMWRDVMWLEPIAALAPGSGANPMVSPKDEPPQVGGHGMNRGRTLKWPATFCESGTNPSRAEELF